jgi:hypothetical protein
MSTCAERRSCFGELNPVSIRKETVEVVQETTYPGDKPDLFRITQQAPLYFVSNSPLPEDFFP